MKKPSHDSFSSIVFGCVSLFLKFFFFFLYLAPRIIIGMGRLIYHIKALSIVIQTTIKNFESQFFSVEKNRSETFDFWSNFELVRINKIRLAGFQKLF